VSNEFNLQSNLSSKEWDSNMSKLNDYNVFQSYNFGEFYKKNKHESTIIRSSLAKGSSLVVMSQARLKKIKLLNFALIYMNGGPMFNFSNEDKVNKKYLKQFLTSFIDEIKKTYKNHYIYLNINSPSNSLDKLILKELGFQRPVFPKNQPFTFILNTKRSLDEIHKSFHPKWRNQLKKSQSYNHTYEIGNNRNFINRFIDIHIQMCDMKGNTDIKISKPSLNKLQHLIKDSLQIVIVKLDDKDVAGCVILTFEQKAYYLYAAANEIARKHYSSNNMIWCLTKYLINNGISELDTSGVDPLKFWGGYNFKKKFSSFPLEYNGEWEYASNKILKHFINFLIKMR